MAGGESKPDNQMVVYEGHDMLAILQTAVDKLGGDGAESVVAAIKELAELKIRLDKVDAEKGFNKALAEFQAECPQIEKKSSSKKEATRAGSSFGYMYAELDEVTKTVAPHLHSRGFSYYWDGKVESIGDKIVMTETCFLRHGNGHSVSSTFSAPVSKEIGSMNEVQRYGALKAYLKRYTLLAILGISTTDVDTDGVSPEKIDDKQLQILRSAIKSSGADERKLCKYLEVDKIEDLRKADFATAVIAVREKEKQAEKPKKQKNDKSPMATPILIKKLDDQITDIENRMEKLHIGQEYINKQKAVIATAEDMTFEQAEKLSITLADIQGQES